MPSSSSEPTERSGESGPFLGLSAGILTGAAAWLAYASILAGVFAMSSIPAWMAVRGAIANAAPDGLLALAAGAAARRLAGAHPSRSGFPLALAALGLPLSALSVVLKSLLAWLDVLLIRSSGTFHIEGAILVWQALISLLIFAAAGGASLARVNAVRAQETAEAAARAESLRARAELASLRAQLNPHFLFNVLHSTLGLVRREPALAEQALERLGDLLRYSLHVHRDGVDWVSLREEWAFMESYLDLERIRLGERLRVSVRSDPAAFDCRVPSFLLQPLVENAVRHGIAPRASGGLVQVRASLDREKLAIEVLNEGEPDQGAFPRGGRSGTTPPLPEGPPPAGRSGLTWDSPRTGAGSAGARPQPGSSAGGREVAEGPPRSTLPLEDPAGLGLRLLRERLAVLYGGAAALAAGPDGSGGFRVALSLPAGSQSAPEEAE